MALPAGAVQWFRGDLGVFKASDKAAACTTDGDTVGAWADQSGSGGGGWDLLQTTAAQRATYQAPNAISGQAKPGVRFEPVTGVTEGSHPSLAISSSLTTDRQALTMFIVGQFMFQAGGYNNQCVIAPGAAGLHGTFYWAPPTTGTNYGRGQAASAVREFGGRSFFGCNKAVYALRSSASALRMYRNLDAFDAPATLSSGTSTGGLLMRFTAGTPWHCFGTLYEIVIYNSALSDANVRAAQDYLMDEHSIPNAYLNIVCDGDSIMAGQNVTTNTSYTTRCQHIPNYIANAIPEAEVYNMAVSGQTVANLTTYRDARVIIRQDASKKLNLYITNIGTNDISAGTDPAVVYAAVQTYCQSVRGRGFKVIISTILPRNDAFSSARATYNGLLRAGYSGFADALADIAADPLLDDDSDTTYYNADRIHLTSAGCGVAAQYYIKQAANLVNNELNQSLRGLRTRAFQ